MKQTKLFKCECGNKFKQLVAENTIIVKCKCGKEAVKNSLYDIKSHDKGETKMNEQKTIYLSDADIDDLYNGRSVAVEGNTILITFSQFSRRCVK